MANIDKLDGRAWMVTIWPQNIRNMGYGDMLNEEDKPKDGIGKEILEAIREDWLCSGKARTSGGVSCISPNDGYHIHLGVYCSCKVAFSTVTKVLGKAHVEKQRSTKEELTAYLRKEGKFQEKGEIVLYESGMDSIEDGQGRRTDLQDIEAMIQQGMTPQQIMDTSMSYRKYEKMIKDAFFSKRSKETPPYRDIEVIWHVGEAGSGKSYNYVKMCKDKEVGEDKIYLLTDYENGGFDSYCAEPILFMDEFKGQMRFQLLLNYLDGYKIQVHARYGNVRALWTTVHITSVYPPEEVYKNMVDSSVRGIDSINQLKRRITTMVYHWKEGDEYKEYAMDMKDYEDYEQLKNKAVGYKDEFISVPEQEVLPFTIQCGIDSSIGCPECKDGMCGAPNGKCSYRVL